MPTVTVCLLHVYFLSKHGTSLYFDETSKNISFTQNLKEDKLISFLTGQNTRLVYNMTLLCTTIQPYYHLKEIKKQILQQCNRQCYMLITFKLKWTLFLFTVMNMRIIDLHTML